MRVWSDCTGRYRAEAKFLGLEAGMAKLERTDGKVVNVPIPSVS